MKVPRHKPNYTKRMSDTIPHNADTVAQLQRPTRKFFFVLAGLWLLVTTFNLFKAVHIDDTVHLEIAKHIRSNPLHPMSGELFWGLKTAEPIHELNQPHLLMYLFAATIAIFGTSEIALHCVAALFSLAAIVFFYLIAREVEVEQPLLLSSLFCCGPVFVPSQNLMTDVPMTALWLASIWCLLRAAKQDRFSKELLAAGILIGFACLTKYTAIVLIPLAACFWIIRGQTRKIWVVAIPIAMLTVWSLFNYLDYGGFHILERNVSAITLQPRLLSWIICLGAICPFSIIALPMMLATAKRRLATLVTVGVALLYGQRHLMQYMDATPPTSVLRILFFVNGIVLIAAVTMAIIQRIRVSRNVVADEKYPKGVGSVHAGLLCLWFTGTAIFVVLFAPFIAVRHFLIIVPPILLLLGATLHFEKRWHRRAAGVGAAATVALGISLGAADWSYADVYRQQASVIRKLVPANNSGTIWYIGHWGWQWYAERNGLRGYDAKSSNLLPGDYLVIPMNVHRQHISKPGHLRFAPYAVQTVPGPAWTAIRSMTYGYGVFRSNIQFLPWSFSNGPMEQFRIMRVEKIAESNAS